MEIVSLGEVQSAVDSANKAVKNVKVPSSLGGFESDVKSWDSIVAEGGQCKSGKGIRAKIKSKGAHISSEIDGMASFIPAEVTIGFSGYKRVEVTNANDKK